MSILQSVTRALTSPPRQRDASDAVSLIDRRGVIRFATPAAAHLYGYRLEDITGRSALRFIAPESIAQARERWLAFRSDPSTLSDEMPITVVSATGHRIAVQVSVWRLPGRK